VIRRECSAKTMASSTIEHSTLFQPSHLADILKITMATTLESRPEMEDKPKNGTLMESPRPLSVDIETMRWTCDQIEISKCMVPMVNHTRYSNTMSNTSSMSRMVEHSMLKEEEILKEAMSLYGRDRKVQTKNGELSMSMKLQRWI
jgi:hypothetical protein